MIAFGLKKLPYCASCRGFCGVTRLCGIYSMMRQNLYCSLMDDEKPYLSASFLKCEFFLCCMHFFGYYLCFFPILFFILFMFSSTYLYYVSDNPLLKHISAYWKFAKNEPAHVAEVFLVLLMILHVVFLMIKVWCPMKMMTTWSPVKIWMSGLPLPVTYLLMLRVTKILGCSPMDVVLHSF